MAKTIALSYRSWSLLRDQIIEDYGRTTVMISWRLKDTLGFTIREHRDYSEDYSSRKPIRLDFYDEQLQTLFLLKYADFLRTEDSEDIW